MKKEYPPLDFINRKKEQEFLLDYFSNIPRNILFLYGPKSTGKTTLIKKVLETLNREKYDISFFNMREHLVVNFRSFVDTFFPPSLKDKSKNTALELLSGSKISLPGFSWEGGEIEVLKKDIFKSLIRKIESLKAEGVQTIIVLDEFQYLRDIKMPEEDILLIDELFKFFIALTKQNNLAHVVCLTSDSYYMEELYNNTKLTNTSDFQMIDHLSQKDIYYWLGEKENCPKEMVQDIWDNLGGSVWEIWQVFVAYKNTGDWKNKLNDLLQVKFSLLAEYLRDGVSEKWKEAFINISKKIAQEGEYKRPLQGERIFPLIKDLVSKDFWFYNTKTGIITANSKSFEVAMQRLIDEITK